ncbi:hypothetical protein [uncultured Algibacter sp.]|uniref:HYC_CC_PP family protein n=1 Tax=uncultured Algibacter sp. TaxID=298659 RepID=UPI0032175954
MFSTISFTVEKHFCGDVLVDVSLFSEAKKCCIETIETITKKPCCKDEIDVVKGQDELKMSLLEDIDFQHQFIVISFAQVYVNLFVGEPKQNIHHKDYSPPNLVTDIQVLDQVFLI